MLNYYIFTEISSQDCGERFIDEDDVSRSRRIIGGNEAAMNSWPWIVNFMTDGRTSQVCAGNLIHPQWILTTAHCFVSRDFQYSVDEWTYIAGDHYLNETDPYEQVKKVIEMRYNFYSPSFWCLHVKS